MNGLYEEVETTFGVAYRVPDDVLASKSQEDIYDELWALTKERYEEKEARFTSDMMRQFERSVFLMVIDNLWKDHLFEMDHLKGGVQFRAFGQKNPLFEYQREGLTMFRELRSTIARDVSKYLFHLERVERQTSGTFSGARTIHDSAEAFAPTRGGAAPVRVGMPAGLTTNRSGGGGQGQPVSKEPIRVGPQVGRNDPCPCGSGKKYKKCHGAKL
jgi:preprotein translocase subunit SecA